MYYIREDDIQQLKSTVERLLSSRQRCMLLIRGLPGSGKSFLGQQLALELDGIQYETDQKFVTAGEYVFDAHKLMAAHEGTRQDVKQSLRQDIPFVVVSNTFTQAWEYESYLTLAAYYHYPVILFDLYLCINQYMMQTLPVLQQVEHNLDVLRQSYLQHLIQHNTHNVPDDKIHAMSMRYEYAEEVVTIVDGNNTMEGEEAAVAHKYFEVLDSGYYLALGVLVAEENTHQHSAIFWACISAVYELLRMFGMASTYAMVRKLINRNLKSHSMQSKEGGRSVVKMNAGWAKLHITLLSPGEYKALQESGQLDDFKAKLSQLRLDEINDSFQYLLDAKKEQCSMSVSLAQQRLLDQMGMIQGDIIEQQSISASLDDFSKALLNAMTRNESTDCSTPSNAMSLSSAFYLLLDSSQGVLQEIQQLRDSYDVVAALQSNWTPHITLAFTHNDIHQHGATASRSFGLKLFQQCRQKATAKRSIAYPHPQQHEGSETTLEEDAAMYPFLAELFLHSEVDASFTSAFQFVICDVKIRKGLFGDDASYKAHPVMLKLLPRGLVFVQYQPTSVVYRGLFSLRKFYGKEGMEDDGFGLSSGELHFHLLQKMQSTKTLMLMEKVNGRAGSCRFFTFQSQVYVIVGTKLAHTVGKVHPTTHLIELCAAYQEDYDAVLKEQAKPVVANAVNDAQDGEEMEVELEGEEEAEPNTTQYEKQSFYRNKLIVSNVLALQQSIKWEHFEEFYEWTNNQTINGEILDPHEMHLVVIDKLQWVFLGTTSFPKQDIDPFLTPSITSSNVANTSPSLLDTLILTEKYFHFVPAYQCHNLSSFDEMAASDEVDDKKRLSSTMKKNHIMALAKKLIYERDSEGKVLYLLNAQGQVLEMIKYKTWWYIYRRSIRELVSKLMGRHRKKLKEDANPDASKSGKSLEKESLLTKLKTQLQNMSKAKNKEHDVAFQGKLQQLRDAIDQLENPPKPLPGNSQLKEALTPFVEEIISEVRRKWPNKFSFLIHELDEQYANKVESAIFYATNFLIYFHQQVSNEESIALNKFSKYYPLMWEEFLHSIGKDSSQDC